MVHRGQGFSFAVLAEQCFQRHCYRVYVTSQRVDRCGAIASFEGLMHRAMREVSSMPMIGGVQHVKIRPDLEPERFDGASSTLEPAAR
jgi:hypothetical protein